MMASRTAPLTSFALLAVLTLLAPTGADSTANAQPLVCKAAENATACMMGLADEKWDAGAAEARQEAEQAREREEKKLASRVVWAMWEVLDARSKQHSGVIFLYLVIACLAGVVCALIGGQLRQNLFGCGPVTVSGADHPAAPKSPSSPPSTAGVCSGVDGAPALVDAEGRVLAARRAELSVPFDHAQVLTTKQWEAVSRVRFSYLPQGEKQSVTVSSDVVGRTHQEGRLQLSLASGRVLCLENEGATLLNADKAKRGPVAVAAGVLIVPHFHMRDLEDLRRRMQGCKLGCNQVDL